MTLYLKSCTLWQSYTGTFGAYWRLQELVAEGSNLKLISVKELTDETGSNWKIEFAITGNEESKEIFWYYCSVMLNFFRHLFQSYATARPKASLLCFFQNVQKRFWYIIQQLISIFPNSLASRIVIVRVASNWEKIDLILYILQNGSLAYTLRCMFFCFLDIPAHASYFMSSFPVVISKRAIWPSKKWQDQIYIPTYIFREDDHHSQEVQLTWSHSTTVG